MEEILLFVVVGVKYYSIVEKWLNIVLDTKCTLLHSNDATKKVLSILSAKEEVVIGYTVQVIHFLTPIPQAF